MRLDLSAATKTCTGCDKVLPLSDFYVSRGRPRSRCKACWREACARRDSANRDRVNATARERYRRDVAASRRKSRESERCRRARPEIRAEILRRQRVTYPSHAEARRAQVAAYTAQAQAITLPRAVNWGKEWTGPELEVAADRTRTAREAASALGRTYKAVMAVRERMLVDPRKARLAGLATVVARRAEP